MSSKPGLEYQRLSGAGQFDGSGLWVVEVKHEGNRNSSPEEVDAVADLVTGLTTPGVRWVNEHGEEAQMTGNRILVVSPYNAQVSRLAERLEPLGVRVGTVDKFQGQEAPVVIYSMATSSPEDTPRGMEFLYSLKPSERGHIARPVCGYPCRQPASIRARVPHAEADEAGERVVSLSGTRTC